MKITHWVSLVLFLFLTGAGVATISPLTEVTAAQATYHSKPIVATTNLLLQEKNTHQTAITQNIQMITALILTTEVEAQQKIFLPFVTR